MASNSSANRSKTLLGITFGVFDLCCSRLDGLGYDIENGRIVSVVDRMLKKVTPKKAPILTVTTGDRAQGENSTQPRARVNTLAASGK
jgi:hypothetical protein